MKHWTFRSGALAALSLAWTLLAAAQAVSAPPATQDGRYNLGLTRAEQTAFLAEMRVMLGSVQGVVQGIAESDREAIERFARISGNRMARATPASIRAKLPPAFQELGAPTHLAFEELAVRAATDDMDQLAAHLGQTLRLCMACHEAFRVR